ncbi:hypothetical protein D3C71_1814040 [compost metagenome]
MVPVLPVGACVITVTLRIPLAWIAAPTSGKASTIFFIKPLCRYFSASNFLKLPFSSAISAEAR